WLEAVFPEAVEPPGSHIGEVERCGAEAADAGDFAHHVAQVEKRLAVVAVSQEWQARGDDAVAQVTPGGNAHAMLVAEGAAAALGREKLVHGGIVDDARDDLALALKGDGDGEERNAVQEVRRAVERIDDPAVLGVVAG